MCLENICDNCNRLSCACPKTVFDDDDSEDFHSKDNISCLYGKLEMSTKSEKKRSKFKCQNLKRNNVTGNQKLNQGSNLNEKGSTESFKVPSSNGGSIISKHLSFNLMSKGLNFGHLNI